MSNEITVKWSWKDVQGMYPKWTKDKCIEAMDEVSSGFYERVVELGNEALEQLLYEMVEMVDELEEEEQ